MRSIPRWWFIKVYDFITTIGIHSTDPVPESLSSSRLALMMRLAYCRRPQTWPFGGTNLVSQLGQTKFSEGNIPQASSWVCDATSLLVETWFCEASWNTCKKKDILKWEIFSQFLELSRLFIHFWHYFSENSSRRKEMW